MSSAEPPPDEFTRGSVLPGVAAGCALPVVGVLLAFLLGLGLIVWAGSRGDDGPSDAAGTAAQIAGPSGAGATPTV